MARVLVADDDPDIRDLARLLIGRYGHQVVTAGDGVEAIAMLAMAPELVVTDFTMPNQDGLFVCRAVRSTPAVEGIPLVLLTALPLTDERIVHASTETNAILLAKTEISRLGELADSLVSGAGVGAIS